MKRVALALLVFLVALAAACALNPQPYPPDNPDAALTGGTDAGNKGNDDASTFGEGGLTEDAATDSAPTPQTDGGTDASDASDASDANDASDAPSDAPSDVATDVVND